MAVIDELFFITCRYKPLLISTTALRKSCANGRSRSRQRRPKTASASYQEQEGAEKKQEKKRKKRKRKKERKKEVGARPGQWRRAWCSAAHALLVPRTGAHVPREDTRGAFGVDLYERASGLRTDLTERVSGFGVGLEWFRGRLVPGGRRCGQSPRRPPRSGRRQC
eukprot:2522173-Rhodomonas_salina.1